MSVGHGCARVAVTVQTDRAAIESGRVAWAWETRELADDTENQLPCYHVVADGRQKRQGMLERSR